jgi:hypothetical protein
VGKHTGKPVDINEFACVRESIYFFFYYAPYEANSQINKKRGRVFALPTINGFNLRTPRGARQPNFKIPMRFNTLIVSGNQYFYLFGYLPKKLIDIRRIFQVRMSLHFPNSLYFAPY